MRMRLTLLALPLTLALAGTAAATGDAPTAFWSVETLEGAYLGVELSDLDGDRARELGLSGSSGVKIERVLDDTAADEAGLEDGDVVLSFDGERVRSASHLGRMVRETAPGRTVEIVYLRDGRERSADVTLGKRRTGSYFAPRPPMPAMPPMPALPPRAPDAPLAFEAYERALFAGGASWKLGIRCDDLSGQLAEFFEVEQGSGVLVEQVVAGSAAEKAGLRAGDVIVALDDERIRSLADLRELLADDERDAAASLVVVRKGRERSLPIELEKVERSGSLWFGDGEAARELRQRYAEQAREFAEQAEALRGEESEIRRLLEQQQREWRQSQRELRHQQRELQRQLRDAQQSLRHSRPSPIAAPAPMPKGRNPTGTLPL